MISRDGLVARIDRRFETPEPEILVVEQGCFLQYGLDVDDDGVLFITGFSCDRVMTYNPLTSVWRSLRTPPSVRGAALSSGLAFVAHTDGRVSAIATNPLALVSTVDLFALGADPFETIGMAVDGFGGVWAASGQNGSTENGVATRLNPETFEVDAQVSLGIAPHTQGDLTGSKLAGEFTPEATDTFISKVARTTVPTGVGCILSLSPVLAVRWKSPSAMGWTAILFLPRPFRLLGRSPTTRALLRWMSQKAGC